MPRKGCCVDIVSSDLCGSGRPHGEERVFARLEPWEKNFALLRDAAKRPLLGMRPWPSNVGEAGRALVDIGAQRRAGIDRQIVQKALGGADRLRAFAGDLARKFQRSSAGVVAYPRREAVSHGFLRREKPPCIG